MLPDLKHNRSSAPMLRFLRFVLILLVIASPCLAQKKRVAVLNFECGTVKSNAAAIFGSDQDVGKGISDMLVQKLVQDGKYSVIERNALDKVLGEQNFSNSDRADASTAAKIGRILGVDAIIIGSITQFGRDDQHTNIGAGGYGGYGSKLGIGGIGTKKSKAVVGITARLVNTTTGEILAAVTGKGESQRSGTSLIGAGAGGGSGGGAGLDMGSSNFGQTILGEAGKAAGGDRARQIDNKAATLPTVKISVSGLVADVSGNTLIINVGSKTGLKIGDNLDVSRQVRTVKDPATGKVLKSINDKIGSGTATTMEQDSATVMFAGTGPVKVGDVAQTP